MPNWVGSARDTKDDLKNIEINPEDIQAAVKPELDSLKTELSTTIDTKLKDITEFIAQQKQEREENARKEAEAQRRQAREDADPDDTDFIADPKNAVARMINPLKETIQAQNAIIVRNEVLGKMDLYSTDPQFKVKVDALLDAQPLATRANAAIVMNAYKSVYFDEKDAIKEGKYKTIASMANLSNNGTGGHSGESKDKDKDNTLTDEEKRYARNMGLTDEQWIQGRRELEYV